MTTVINTQSTKVNEVVTFLESFAPEKMAGLKAQFADHQDLLKGGILQGEEEPGYNFSELLVKAAICREGLKEVVRQCSTQKPTIRARLKKLVNIQLVTQILIAISGASIITTLSSKVDTRFSIYAAACAFLGSLLTIYIQFKSGILGQNNRNVFQLFDVLISNNLKAEAGLKEMDFLLEIRNPNTYNNLNDLIRDCNTMCYNTRKILEDLQ